MQDLGNELLGRRHGGNRELREDEFWAVRDVSFEVKRGECLGLIGRNGAGKTTLLRMLNGLIKPDKGRIEMRGRVGALIALGAGFNPILTGRENIYVNGSVLGLSKKEIGDKIEEIIDFAEIHEFIDAPVQSYSSGMQVRLGFAVASSLEPDILILDEILAVGDAGFKSKCFNRIGRLIKQCAVIFVTHSMHQLYRISSNVIVMEKGTVIKHGPAAESIKVYDQINIYFSKNTSVFLDQSVKSFDLNIPSAITSKSLAKVDINVISLRTLKIGLVIINFTDARTGLLVAEHRKILDDVIINEGEVWQGTFRLGPIMLRTGEYLVACAVYDQSGRVNLAHADNYRSIYVNNSTGTEAVSTM